MRLEQRAGVRCEVICGFTDRSAGVRARVWVRFLHTGEAGGTLGRIVAFAATFGSLVLVWTGCALSWRRLRSRSRGTAANTRAKIVP
ncbi:MAG: PepSY domain-containing protein [Verrucomicrobia bacterium]|nr:PepSY domain-containing protein [Verrucomicrobiota bacterium]